MNHSPTPKHVQKPTEQETGEEPFVVWTFPNSKSYYFLLFENFQIYKILHICYFNIYKFIKYIFCTLESSRHVVLCFNMLNHWIPLRQLWHRCKSLCLFVCFMFVCFVFFSLFACSFCVLTCWTIESLSDSSATGAKVSEAKTRKRFSPPKYNNFYHLKQQQQVWTRPKYNVFFSIWNNNNKCEQDQHELCELLLIALMLFSCSRDLLGICCDIVCPGSWLKTQKVAVVDLK